MTESDLMELAAKIEALEGPDRNVDCAIFATVRPDVFGDDAALYARLNWTRNRADWIWLRDQGMPSYTASLDAAMSLIEDGDEWQLSTIYNIARAEVGVNRDHHTSWPGHGEHAGCNPVLALLSAALKARASLSRLSPPKEVTRNG